MQPWQVQFIMVPERALVEAQGKRTTIGAHDWWNNDAFPEQIRGMIAAVLPPGGASQEGVETWGAESGNRIDIHSRSGAVSRVLIYVDVRKLDSMFGAALILILREANALLIRSDGMVVEPTINAFSAALKTSEAWKYASDPGTWIKENLTE
jgi:hypothetical protein